MAESMQAKKKSQLLGNTKCVSEFEKLFKIGHGTYGTVYRAKHKSTGQIYALKQVNMAHESDGFPITSLREISIL
eukprot:CAMPEP_0116886242 /NCGR_PEP_ID=MMETSP0463-20121206/19974_1 /TAXON_ID=181622 /ORGANISM="Strombidinopsis sp, Strain SopsisLIS2011" /LENGTH=74 /DNA_ID=CAMNT_0004546231 /DNA_START=24 /DNA_END=248 /DNA_ORIENTATION=-